MKRFLLAFALSSATVASAWSQDDDFRVFLTIGGTYHAPRTDYVSQFGGLNLGLSAITFRKNVYMIDFVAGAGEARKDFHTSDGWIYKDDDLTVGQLYFNYGRVVKETHRCKLTPFVGMGVISYDYTLYSDGDDGEDDIVYSKAAFSTKVGACYDICLSNPLHDVTHSIRIQPMAAVSFYGSPLNVVPSFNLSISYCLGFDF